MQMLADSHNVRVQAAQRDEQWQDVSLKARNLSQLQTHCTGGIWQSGLCITP